MAWSQLSNAVRMFVCQEIFDTVCVRDTYISIILGGYRIPVGEKFEKVMMEFCCLIEFEILYLSNRLKEKTDYHVHPVKT